MQEAIAKKKKAQKTPNQTQTKTPLQFLCFQTSDQNLEKVDKSGKC